MSAYIGYFTEHVIFDLAVDWYHRTGNTLPLPYMGEQKSNLFTLPLQVAQDRSECDSRVSNDRMIINRKNFSIFRHPSPFMIFIILLLAISSLLVVLNKALFGLTNIILIIFLISFHFIIIEQRIVTHCTKPSITALSPERPSHSARRGRRPKNCIVGIMILHICHRVHRGSE